MEWNLDVSTAPTDGTRFVGVWYWPTPNTCKRFADSVLKRPADGVKYHYATMTYRHKGMWYVDGHTCPEDQDGFVAYLLLDDLPLPPETKEITDETI